MLYIKYINNLDQIFYKGELVNLTENDINKIVYTKASYDELTIIQDKFDLKEGKSHRFDANVTIPMMHSAGEMIWYGSIARTIIANLNNYQL